MADTQTKPLGQFVVNNFDVLFKDGFYLMVNLFGTMPQTAANYSHFFTARHPMEVLRVTETHAVLGTDAGAVTLDIEKLTSGTAPGSGTSILNSTFSLKSTINTPVTKEGSSLAPSRQLKEGERLALKLTGTPTAVQSLQVTLYCKHIGRGSYK